MNTFFIKTYGCQMNEYDSEKIATILSSIGYNEVLEEKEASLIILNTCCVRKTAEEKVYGELGNLKKLKIENKNLKIIVAGCLAQKEGTNIIKKFPYVDATLGSLQINKLSKLVKALKCEESQEEIIPERIKRKSKIKAYLPVIFGCNYNCTFCIVPFVRGREISRDIDDILQEIEELKNEGYKEITLVGQNILAYGRDRKDNTNFAKLLQRVAETGIPRIRFVTSHPKDLTDEVIDTISRYDNICKHLHLPLQAGSNKILKKMNRLYTAEYYKEIYIKLCNKLRNFSLSTDIIVGFPSEDENDFNQTIEMLKEIQFDQVFSFVYSKRDGTKAATFDDNVPHDVKLARLHKLNELQTQISLNNNKKLIGKIQEVLVEDYDNKKNKLFGRTSQNKLVYFEGEKELIDNFVNIEIQVAKPYTLEGKILRPTFL